MEIKNNISDAAVSLANGFIKRKLNDGLTIDMKTNALPYICKLFDFYIEKKCLQTSKFISGIT